MMRKTVAFNPHWVNKKPSWDIRLLNGDIHRSVAESDIRKTSSRQHMDVVRECDIQDYGSSHLRLALTRGNE